MDSWTLTRWVSVAAVLAADPKRSVVSFVCLSVEECIQAARRDFYERRGRLPPRAFEQTIAPRSRRLFVALERAYGPGEWWRADVWEPRRDPRIPVREHEPIGNARLRFAEIGQPWLRGAIKWFFARPWSRACWRGRRCLAIAPTSEATSRSSCSRLGWPILPGRGRGRAARRGALVSLAPAQATEPTERRTAVGGERRPGPDRSPGVLPDLPPDLPVHGRSPARGRAGAGRAWLVGSLRCARPLVAGRGVRRQAPAHRPDRLHRSRCARSDCHPPGHPRAAARSGQGRHGERRAARCSRARRSAGDARFC